LRSRVLQCSAIGEVPLKQLRSLYELVEDLVADAVLPELPLCFRTPLPGETERERLDLVDRACRVLGECAVSAGAGAGSPDALAALDAAKLRAGRLRLEPALKRFIHRELKQSAIISEAMLNSSLYHWVMSPEFPWSTGDQVTDQEVDDAFDENGAPALRHAYQFWRELKRRGGDAER
jgi:hypothetical protein